MSSPNIGGLQTAHAYACVLIDRAAVLYEQGISTLNPALQYWPPMSKHLQPLSISSYQLVHCHGTSRKDLLDLCKLPLLVAQWASTASLQPTLDAVQVEHMPAATPCYTEAGMVWIPRGVRLVLNAGLVQVVTADSAGVGADCPGPHRNCVPLLDLEALPGFVAGLTAAGFTLLLSRLHLHLVVRHPETQLLRGQFPARQPRRRLLPGEQLPKATLLITS